MSQNNNIKIIPQVGVSSDPKIEFTGAGNSTITLSVGSSTLASLEFKDSSGDIFVIGSTEENEPHFSVTDKFSVPMMEGYLDSRLLLAPYPSYKVGIGTTNATEKLTVYGNVFVSGVVTATTFSGSGSNLTNLTGASAATYGSATNVAQVTVDANGRITGISNVAISGGGGGGISNYVKYVGTGTPDLNASTSYAELSWINTTPQFSNGTWSATSEHVVVPNNGIYLVQVNFYITASVQRSNIGLKFAVNDTQQTEIAANNYIRSASGHTESSINMATTLSLSANDQVSIYIARLAIAGTVSLQGTSSTLAITQLA